MDQGIRLNKFIRESGYCSRREADTLIEEGRVTLNGQPTELGTRVLPGDRVQIDGQGLQSKPTPVYLAFNKPRGIICTTDPKVPDNIVDFIDYPERIFPIGRLDVPSEGLIFLTNDGSIVNKILRAGNHHEKEYLVQIDRHITPAFLKRMSSGVPILDTVTRPCRLEQVDWNTFLITLTQGLNRQVRRMCEALGYEVKRLRRIRIMHVRLGELPVGEWRKLTRRETEELLHQVEHSKATPGGAEGFSETEEDLD